MDDTLAQMPGELKLFAYISCGVMITLPLLAIPKKVLGMIGKLPGLSPNWISFWRFPITWIGYWLYFGNHPFTGFCIVVFALTLDRIDGKVAASLDEENDPRYPGKTPMGKWLDPFVDKLTVPPVFIIFAHQGMLNQWLVSLMLIGEVIGTLIRDPFISRWPLSLLRQYVRQDDASGFGKMKFIMQFTCMLILLPLHRGWMHFSLKLPNTVTAVIDILTFMSVASRLHMNKKFQDIIDGVTAGFRHNKD